MDWINSLIDTYNIPLLSAFLIGIMTSLSPCPLATNITAIAFISKEIKTTKNTLLNGLFYTIGRGLSYTILATLIYFGLSSFQISSIFQGWGDKVLGPLLILIGLVMFDVIKLNFKNSSSKVESLKVWLSRKGYIGSFLLGMLFALAFCPYSGVLFFGVLIPLVLKSSVGLLLPPLFALGTGLPVIIFSFIIAFSANKIGQVFSKVSKVETVIRKITALVFILVGVYYLKYLLF
ncbi:MAG: aromatic aminobenezylarsenical efflux permease ArsG family transporter [Candidatus Shapirobacteria bacterium]|nr:aromatic aminobenezylarsenical efflux permease ArsG family transporter [Candidatus Shapirobacteria bacterium]